LTHCPGFPARALLALLLLLAVAGCAPELRPMGPATTEPEIGNDHLIAADGARLPLRVWRPEGAPTAAIVAVHGFNDYSNAFAMPAPYWAARGIVTYAYDQRGFGGAPDRGYWAGAPTLAADLRAAVAAVRRRHPGLPLHVVGVSMGGAVTMTALADGGLPGIAGAALVAPAVWGRAHMNAIERGLLWLAANTVPGLPMTVEAIEIRPSDNIAMLRRLARDPLVIHETRVDAVKGLVDLMDAAFAAGPRLAGRPVLMLYGQRDDLVPENPSLAVMRTLLAHPGARAALYENGHHMLLRDLAAETVWRDIAAWVADKTAPLPSGADARAARLPREE